MRRVRATIVVVEKQWILYIVSESVAIVSLDAMRMRHIVICGLPQFYNIFSTFSHKRYDFRKKVTEHKMWDLIFSTTFVWNISHSKKKWARYNQKRLVVFM